MENQTNLSFTGLKPVKDNHLECIKCKSLSGDDWSQCEGQCPVKGSPHFDAGCLRVFEDIPNRDQTK